MKKYFLGIFTCIILIGCSQKEQENIQLDQSTFEGFNVDIFKDFIVPLENSRSSIEINKILADNFEEVSGAITNDEQITGIKYDVTFIESALKFHNISIIEESNSNKSSRIYDCPEGQTLVKRCYNKTCVEETLAELADEFSSGETITIYHGGFGGIRICSDVE